MYQYYSGPAVGSLFALDHTFVCLWCDREEINKSKFNTMIGLADHERVDEELYDDFESAKAREVCQIYCMLS